MLLKGKIIRTLSTRVSHRVLFASQTPANYIEDFTLDIIIYIFIITYYFIPINIPLNYQEILYIFYIWLIRYHYLMYYIIII